MVVEAAPVIPREEDRRGLPVGAAHDRVDERGHVRLADGHEVRWMLADAVVRHDPRHRRQRPLARGREEVA